MSKDPAFLFYSQDFLVGVMDMDWEDRGKFITLLATMHQKGRLPEKTIRFLVGNVSDTLKEKFTIDENELWYNIRLEVETEKRKRFVESRRENAKKGGRPKKASGKPKGKASGKLKDKHKGNLIEDENEDENKIENGVPILEDFLIYGKEICKEVKRDFSEYEFSFKAKYESWVANKWRDGHNKPIKNWKNSLRNVFPHLKPIYKSKTEQATW